jgi:uroporphyrinogen-III synthase
MKPFLVTRPEPDAQASVERLAALGIEAVAAPLMTRLDLPANLPDPAGFAALAITSSNALRALVVRNGLQRLRETPVFAVGDRTAHEARLMGFASVIAAEGTLASLTTAIALARLEGPVLYLAGRHLSGDLAQNLAPHGLMVITVPVYDMVAETALPPAVGDTLATAGFGAVMIYSRRTAEIFCSVADPVLSRPRRSALPVICLSENVAAPLLQNHFNRVLLADHPSEDAMMALALAFAREQTGS